MKNQAAYDILADLYAGKPVSDEARTQAGKAIRKSLRTIATQVEYLSLPMLPITATSAEWRGQVASAIEDLSGNASRCSVMFPGMEDDFTGIVDRFAKLVTDLRPSDPMWADFHDAVKGATNA